MKFLQKNFFVLACALFIYGAYFFTHQQHPFHATQVLGTQSNLTLFEEPQDGRQFLVDAINNAQKEIDMEMYLLSDKQIITALIDAHQRGVVVNVLLEQHPFESTIFNTKTRQTLQSAGVNVGWTNSSFALTHEKGVVIDNTQAFILSQNLTTSSFTKNREFDIIDTNPSDVQEIDAMFFADAKKSSFNPPQNNLVISPDTSRDLISSLIQSAQKQIDIEMEVIDDRETIQLLEQKAATVDIEIILPDFSKVTANKSVASELESKGVKVKTISSPYIHAKAIVVDGIKAYVGSINLTTQSMDQNRELGIIISEPDVVQSLQSDFDNDWSLH